METIDYATPDTQGPVFKEKALLLIDEAAPVESVYVDVWNDDELVHEAAVEVKYVSGNLGVNSMDPKMGSTETIPCETCNLEHPRCPGHWGYIDLKDTFVRSSYVHKQLIQMIVSCICIHCHRPYFDFDKEIGQATRQRVPKLTACFKYIKSKDGECSVCGKKIYSIIEDDNRNPKLNKFSELEIGIDKTSSMPMPLEVLRKILVNLLPIHRKTLGIEGIETEDFFFSKLPVMPNNIRPKRNFEGKEEVHQFTVLYEKIAKVVDDMNVSRMNSTYKTIHDKERKLFFDKIYIETLNELKDIKPELLTEDEINLIDRTNLNELIMEYNRVKTEKDRATDSNNYYSWKNKRRIVNLHVREFDNAYGQQTFKVKFATPGTDKTEKYTPILKKSEGVNIDMNTLVKSKHGLVREKIMGKRVNFCARTVASPAPFRGRSDEVWVPEKFRNTLLMTDSVTSDNRETLRRMAENKMIVYVVLKDDSHADVPFRGERTRWNEFLYFLRSKRFPGNPIDYLKEGDEIERQLIEGVNYVLLNRQPSIWRYSLGAFRVRFWDNGTIGVPDVALKAFNGDFDGDEFNIWTIRDKKTEAEIIQMFSPVKNILGNARNSTAYGLHYDPVTGIFLITRIIERKLPLPDISNDYGAISDFLGNIETQYFEEQNEKLSSRRYFRIFLRKEGNRNVVVFSSETVVPRDYFIDEVREHIFNMKGKDLTSFHQALSKHKIFYIPENENNTRDLGRSYCGRAAFSLLLPSDFFFDNGKVKIEGGVLVKGTITKSEIGAFSHLTIFHELTRLYGSGICGQVMDCLVWFTKTYLTRGNTISFGLEDYGFVGRDAEKETDRVAWVRKLVSEYQSVYTTLRNVALSYKPQLEGFNLDISINNILQDIRKLRATEEVKGFLAEYCSTEDEKSARNLLLAAATLEEKNESIYKEVKAKVEDLELQKKEAESKREFNKVNEIEGKIIELLNGIRSQEAKNIESVVDPDNAFLKCEGKRGNIYEVMGSVGLQTVSGKRIYTGSASNRALPSIFPGDTSPEALGMVLGNFTRGLDPSEAAFLSWAARIGPVVTKTQTSVIGDIANRMTNAFQGIVMKNGIPQETIRESSNAIQMSYNYDNIDPKYLVVRKGDQQFDSSIPPSQRTDFRADKPGQTVIDVSNIQVKLNTYSKNLSPLASAEELEIVNQFLTKRIVNKFTLVNPPTDGSVYVVNGVSYVTTQKSVNNVRNMIRQSVFALKFPADNSSQRRMIISETLEDVLSRITGIRNKIRVEEPVQVKQGDKVGRFISGAIQQPIMQAALNSVVWEERVVVRDAQNVHIKPIGEFIDSLLNTADHTSIQHYSLNQTEYLDVSSRGFEIQSVDEDGKMSWRLVEAITRHDVPEGGLVHVKTLSGRSVKATVGKSFLVRRDNKIIAINGSELSVGDRLPVTRQAPEPMNPLKAFNVSEYFPKDKFVYSTEVAKAIRFMNERSGKNSWWTPGVETGVFKLPYNRSDSFMVAYTKGRFDVNSEMIYSLHGKASASKLPVNLELNELTGFFFGAYLADGCSNEYQVIISKKDETFRSRIEDFAKTMGINYHTVVSSSRNVSNGESTDLRLHSQMLARVMRECCGSASEGKHIPSWSVIARRSFVKGLLDGYFSGDGTVNKRDQSIVVTSASETLLLGICELLTRFGIVCKKSMHTMSSNNVGSQNILPVHSLTIRNEYSRLFLNEIGLTVSSKMEVLEQVSTKTFNNQKFLYERIPVKLSGDSTDNLYLISELAEMYNSRDVSDQDKEIISRAVDSDVYFDEIVSIEPTSTTISHPKVYDFTVEKTRTFSTLGGLNVMDTFHSSGQASSASSVKDRFIRLVTASSSGKRSGTMILNKTPNNFYSAYRVRNMFREVSLATILKNPAPTMYYDVQSSSLPSLIRKLFEIEYPNKVNDILPSSGNISYIMFEYDPLTLKTYDISTADLKRFLVSVSTKSLEFYPVFVRDVFYLFSSEKDSLKARDGFQRNIISRLADHKLNFGYRFSGEGMEEIYPTEFKITEGIRTVYQTDSNSYVIKMSRRHMNRFGYKLADVMSVFESVGITKTQMAANSTNLTIEFSNVSTSPVKLVEKKLSEEADVVDAEWKKSVESGKRKEPEYPGLVTSRNSGYFMKTIGGSMSFMLRNPLVNYRSSYTDGILDIEENLGLRAARNFMVYEIEQIFALSGSNEIDYRHVVLMIDSMVSQGSISRLTFQGVDKMAGPNPLNQAGLGFAPSQTFAVAALKKKEYAADVGYSTNFLATRPKISIERPQEEVSTLKTQEERISKYVSQLPSLRKTKEKTQIDYQVIKDKRAKERQYIENVYPHTSEEPQSRRPVSDLCQRPVVINSRVFDTDVSEYYNGPFNGLDVFGQPTEL